MKTYTQLPALDGIDNRWIMLWLVATSHLRLDRARSVHMRKCDTGMLPPMCRTLWWTCCRKRSMSRIRAAFLSRCNMSCNLCFPSLFLCFFAAECKLNQVHTSYDKLLDTIFFAFKHEWILACSNHFMSCSKVTGSHNFKALWSLTQSSCNGNESVSRWIQPQQY